MMVYDIRGEHHDYLQLLLLMFYLTSDFYVMIVIV